MTAAPSVPGPSSASARRWVARWERQQERYARARDARFAAMLDVVERTTRGVDRPLIVDLGCGPGSLARRIADRLPRAEVVAVDADPFLIALGRAAAPQVRYVLARIGADGWASRLALGRAPDVFATSTTLHYLAPAVLAPLYRDLCRQLRPGGLLVNGDHLPAADPAVAELAQAVAGDARSPGGADTVGDDWASWWAGVAADPDLGPVLAATGRSGPAVDGDHVTDVREHEELLRAAGFGAVGTVWRSGPSAVLAAVTPLDG